MAKPKPAPKPVPSPAATPGPSPVPAPSNAAAPGGTARRVAAPEERPLEARLQQLGLTEAQVSGVLEITRETVERVVWEVVPDLAEAIIREEIRRLTAE